MLPKLPDDAPVAQRAAHAMHAALVRRGYKTATEIALRIGESPAAYSNCLHGRTGSLARVYSWTQRLSGEGLNLELRLSPFGVSVVAYEVQPGDVVVPMRPLRTHAVQRSCTPVHGLDYEAFDFAKPHLQMAARPASAKVTLRGRTLHVELTYPRTVPPESIQRVEAVLQAIKDSGGPTGDRVIRALMP